MRESVEQTPIRDGELIAAVDMGSNSFHMVVARMEHGEPRVIDRLRDTVRMAAGLRADGTLEATRRTRALHCLARFGQRMAGLPAQRVARWPPIPYANWRIRKRPSTAAEAALGHPIEVVSGREEARLRFLAPRTTCRIARIAPDHRRGRRQYRVHHRPRPGTAAHRKRAGRLRGLDLALFPGRQDHARALATREHGNRRVAAAVCRRLPRLRLAGCVRLVGHHQIHWYRATGNGAVR